MAAGGTSLLARGAALAIALAFATGCAALDGGSDALQPTRTSGRLAVYEVDSAGFSIGVPRAWRAINVDEALEGDTFEDLAAENPQLALFAEAIANGDSGAKFFAADPDVEEEFATNVNVVVFNAPDDMSWEQFARQNREEIAAMVGTGGRTETETVAVAGLRAQRIEYEMELVFGGVPKALGGLQYEFLENGRVYVVTYTTLASRTSEYADDFAESIESFRVDD